MTPTKTLKKLNYKRTFIIGLAFFSILMMWQIYNVYCPLFLTDLLKDVMPGTNSTDVQWIVGIIMAGDNILAIFMLPLFGYLSDITKSKFGKRMPYIIVGTILSCITLPLIPLMYSYSIFAGVVTMMGLTLVFMNAYRNPAVSLMPDLTPKPLRAKANGIINFVGYIGAIVAGGLGMFIEFNKYKTNALIISIPFIISVTLMILSLILLVFKVKENKIEEEMKEEMELGESLSEKENDLGVDKLTKRDKINLFLIIGSVFLWFCGFNAIETFWSSYSNHYLQAGNFSICTIVLTIASLITFIPGGMLSSKIGRKWTVILGLVLLCGALLWAFFVPKSDEIASVLEDGSVIYKGSLQFYFIFFIAGIGWALINVCSYPMIVELANKNNIGKYTGFYYTSSMVAQSITPIAIGLLFNYIGWHVMFIYSFGFIVAATLLFVFIKTKKKNNITSKKGFESFDN